MCFVEFLLSSCGFLGQDCVFMGVVWVDMLACWFSFPQEELKTACGKDCGKSCQQGWCGKAGSFTQGL